MQKTENSSTVALVTGASSGIGAIYADRLARRGHDLILVARSEAKLKALAARLQAETGRSIEVLPADLTVKQDMLRVEQRLQSDERIRLLVNNAGIGATSALVDSDPDRLDDMIQLNVTALTRLTRAVAPGMARRGKGAIINIASIVAVAPERLNGTYGGSKAFVLAFTQSLHHELGAKGVQVQAVLPGATRQALGPNLSHASAAPRYRDVSMHP
jgi:short-subunit dehydrogenase